MADIDIRCHKLRMNLETAQTVQQALTYRSVQAQLEGFHLIRTLLVEGVEDIDAEVERVLKELKEEERKKK